MTIVKNAAASSLSDTNGFILLAVYTDTFGGTEAEYKIAHALEAVGLVSIRKLRGGDVPYITDAGIETLTGWLDDGTANDLGLSKH
jgi:hypothetical protein